MSEPKALSITKHLPVPLTDKRKIELVEELANHVNVYKQLEKLKKDTAESYTKSMSSHRTESEALSQVVASGVEMKLIACVQNIYPYTNEIETKRMDTGEVIERRAMTPEEIKEQRKTNKEGRDVR